jgi:hypothetical protein
LFFQHALYGCIVIDSGYEIVLILYDAHVFGVGIHAQGNKGVFFSQFGEYVGVHDYGYLPNRFASKI